jgi:hypothetical protein
MRPEYACKFFSSTPTFCVDITHFNAYWLRQRKTLALWRSTSSFPQPQSRSP